MTVPVRAVWRLSGVPVMALWSLAGRFGFGMLNLSLLLFVQAETGSYATAGIISASSLLGTAAGAVVQGRLIDRHGPSRPMLVLVAPHAALAAAEVAGIAAGISPVLLAVVVAAQCATLPAMAVASRAMWPHLIPEGPTRDAAYAYEAVSFELCWLLGPAAAGLLATLMWPGTALLVSLGLVTVAALGFCLSSAVRSHRGVSAARPAAGATAVGGRTGVPGQGGLPTLLVAAAGFGLAIGFVVVGVAAGTAANGAPELAGLLLAIWSLSSVLSGLVYQRRPWPRTLSTRLPVLMFALATFLGVPVLASGLAGLTVMVVLSGATLVPQVSTQNTVLDGLVPPARLTEAYGWVTTVIAITNAAGQALGGLVVERYDHRTGFLVAAVCVGALTLPVVLRRRTLTGPGPGRRPDGNAIGTEECPVGRRASG
ncbi:MFS transporter [Plantactinospora sp. CA-290183]|uniref:MFS transporter n=1 Tax=Plantactinospora sp. CA-290183 TaxID=3240006 RepID=UPI003D918032